MLCFCLLERAHYVQEKEHIQLLHIISYFGEFLKYPTGNICIQNDI